MARFDESIEVNANVTEAYNLFSQFERFPGFMEGVEEVRRTGPDTLHWRAEIAGREEEWDAKITEEVPDTRVAWQSVSGSRNFGEVTFEKLDEDSTEVHLHVEYEPEGFVENVGTLLGVVNARMKGDLMRFKEIVESGGHEAGWHDPADRSRAAADRDRAIGEAQRSVHRDDMPANRTVDSAGTVTGGAVGGTAGPLERHVDRAGNALERGVDSAADKASRGLQNASDIAHRGARQVSDAADDLDRDADVDPLTDRPRRDV